MELIPTKATFAPGEAIVVEVRGAVGAVELQLWHLDRLVATTALAPGQTMAHFPAQPEGGYGVEAPGARTAVDVLEDPLERPRYGFVSHYEEGREVAGVADNVRRLHLNAVQFYDWMYRHAELLPPADLFQDSLGQTLSLATVKRLAQAVHDAGSLPIGYAAVYAAGREAWPSWREAGLCHADGSPMVFGDDYLWYVDPSNERWLAHLSGELRAALREVGFAGFHLDQYGAPKWALRRDGSVVDLASAFPALIDRLAADLPEAHLIFNNVNDFPTWATASADQDATYIEVWPPHTRLAHAAGLIDRARAFGPDKTPILAAYLSCYQGGEAPANLAERLLQATAWSHGGTALLHGEEHAVLTEAYYVDHAELGADSYAATRRSYDFAVRYGDLLFDPSAVDITRTVTGGINLEITVSAPVPVATDAEAGSLWVRVVRTVHGLVIHLIDLSSQTDDRWDSGKLPMAALEGVRVKLQRRSASAPAVRFASPDDAPAMVALEPHVDAADAVLTLPSFRSWAMVWVREGDQG